MTLPRPLLACVGLIKPEVLPLVLTGGLEVPTELPLEEDLEAGILATDLTGAGFGTGFGAGGALFTVATEAELFRELRELRREALDVDRSTLSALGRLGVRFGSIGVLRGGLESLVGVFFGMSGDLAGLGEGESQSTLEEAPCDALSELRL